MVGKRKRCPDCDVSLNSVNIHLGIERVVIGNFCKTCGYIEIWGIPEQKPLHKERNIKDEKN